MTIASGSPTLLDRALGLVRARDGRLTRELLRAPGGFGLGQVPAAKTPDATTGMVCGFCSTGCGLTIHLRDGEAVSLTPDDRLPGQPRHGLPQGLGGPDASSMPPTAPPCRCCGTPTAGSGRSTGTTAHDDDGRAGSRRSRRSTAPTRSPS